MANDLSYYYDQKRSLEREINAKEKERKRLESEYNTLCSAFNDLKVKYSVVDRAKTIEKETNSKKLGSNLQWRGKRKNDFDKLANDLSKKDAKKFREEVNQFQNDLRSERDKKKKVLISVNNALNGWNGLYSRLSKVKKKIEKLEREG